MNRQHVSIAMVLVYCSLAVGQEPSGLNALLIEDSFDRTELGAGWNLTTGDWKIVDGVLRASEIKSEKHAAAARRVAVTDNAVYELKFRFVGDGKTFHFGFDPARGELEKRGHLFSVVVNRDSWSILKHVDKNRPKEDPNETLAKQKTNFESGQWYNLRVQTAGNQVTATIQGKEPLSAMHATFAVKKPALVFRCIGDGVEIDDLKVRKASAQ